jgi:Winged helix DNA-binding domain
VADAARTMVAIHGTDVASMYLQACARLQESSPESIGLEMYETRSVLRVLAMRRTLFLVPVDEVATLHAAASLAVGRRERERTLAMFAAGGVGPDTAGMFDELERIGLAAVRERGEATTAELTALDPRLGQRIALAPGKSYASSISVSQKVFFHLALDGYIGRGRPRGSWTGSQVRWSPIGRWLPDGVPQMPTDVAQARLVRQWLRVFGPGTREDLRWWTGWTVAAVRAALAANDAIVVDLDDGETGWLLPDDVAPDPSPEPWVALLPALDATTMGWSGRAWYLGPYKAIVFDSNGNAGPTIWVDGRIVGGWAQRASGGVATRVFEDIGREATAAVEREAARLEAWLGDASVRSSFPTPIDIELRAS